MSGKFIWESGLNGRSVDIEIRLLRNGCKYIMLRISDLAMIACLV